MAEPKFNAPQPALLPGHTTSRDGGGDHAAGTRCLLTNRPGEALPFLERACERPGAPAGAWHHLALARHLTRHHAEAVSAYRQAATDPVLAADPLFLQHGARIYREAGLLSEALACADLAVRLRPDDPRIRFTRALIHLMRSDWRQGWEDYEHRWQGWDRQEKAPVSPYPRWQGEPPPAGSGLLIHAEQGLGDCLQFARYALLARRYFDYVRLLAPAALVPLFQHSFRDRIDVVRLGDEGRNDAGPIAYHSPLLSLPWALLRQGPFEFAPDPYLFSEPERKRYWLDHLPQGAARIGFVWSGGSQTAAPARDIPLDALKPLLVQPNLHFVSLQHNLRLRGGSVSDPLACGGDFADTAAIVANLDLVVSVDTSVAHLAGAMGNRVILLNRYESEWRWGRGTDHCPWYPTMQILTQPTPGDWASVVGRCIELLSPQAQRFRSTTG